MLDSSCDLAVHLHCVPVVVSSISICVFLPEKCHEMEALLSYKPSLFADLLLATLTRQPLCCYANKASSPSSRIKPLPGGISFWRFEVSFPTYFLQPVSLFVLDHLSCWWTWEMKTQSCQTHWNNFVPSLWLFFEGSEENWFGEICECLKVAPFKVSRLQVCLLSPPEKSWCTEPEGPGIYGGDQASFWLGRSLERGWGPSPLWGYFWADLSRKHPKVAIFSAQLFFCAERGGNPPQLPPCQHSEWISPSPNHPVGFAFLHAFLLRFLLPCSFYLLNCPHRPVNHSFHNFPPYSLCVLI